MQNRLHIINEENPIDMKIVIHVRNENDEDVLNPLTVTPYTRDSETFFQNRLVTELSRMKNMEKQESDADREDDEAFTNLMYNHVFPRFKNNNGVIYIVGDKWENMEMVRDFILGCELSPAYISHDCEIPYEIKKEIESSFENNSFVLRKRKPYNGVIYTDEFALMLAEISIMNAHTYIEQHDKPLLRDCERVTFRDSDRMLVIRLNDLAILPSPDITDENYILGYITPTGLKNNNLGLAVTIYRGGCYVMQRCGECKCNKLCRKQYLSDNKLNTGDIMLPDNRQCFQEKARLITDYIIGKHYHCLDKLEDNMRYCLQEACEWLKETEPMLYAYFSYRILERYGIKETTTGKET